MTVRLLLASLLLVAVTLATATAVPSQTPPRKVIEVIMSEFKFEPNQIRFNEGDVVVLRLSNAGPLRTHNLSTRYWMDIPLTVRGEAREGTSESRKWVALDVGKRAEVEFVARGRGSFAFLCSIFDHADRGQTGAFFSPAVAHRAVGSKATPCCEATGGNRMGRRRGSTRHG